jgi:hypothetical protein
MNNEQLPGLWLVSAGQVYVALEMTLVVLFTNSIQ